MGGVSLYAYQEDALGRMRNGCILCGGVGSGKSRTGLAYYYTLHGGRVNAGKYVRMKAPRDLYIVTTARKRDSKEWLGELAPFMLSTEPSASAYPNKVVVDSWNNVGKYAGVEGAFFIFDEQRVVGSGAWVKAFLKIAKANEWILLSATPGDSWSDYIPVFLANGFYRNRTEFMREHAVYARFSKYPRVDRWVGTKKLSRLRDRVLVKMDYFPEALLHHQSVAVDYDRELYREVSKTRWDPFKDEPVQNAGVLCYVWRKVVNSHPSRAEKVRRIVGAKRRAIIFYSFDYELEILKGIDYGPGVEVAQWNGHAHEDIPPGDSWAYLVQYSAGCEGWNCTRTDTTIFYSLSYSYKVVEQATGRINRLNTPYRDLHYYHLESQAPIDRAIRRALDSKKIFNEGKFVKW